MDYRNIAYIRTEPIEPSTECECVSGPSYRCTIELSDGSTIMRCGLTVEHALANALESYQSQSDGETAQLESYESQSDGGTAQ